MYAVIFDGLQTSVFRTNSTSGGDRIFHTFKEAKESALEYLQNQADQYLDAAGLIEQMPIKEEEE